MIPRFGRDHATKILLIYHLPKFIYLTGHEAGGKPFESDPTGSIRGGHER